MTLPGVPFIPFLTDVEDDERAAWMLSLIDASGPDKRVVIAVERPDGDERIDDLEEQTRRAFNLAKAERPGLAVKLLPAAFVGERADRTTAIAVVLHEHQWVGGLCVNGCTDTRDV
jgi:hypothetical protein